MKEKQYNNKMAMMSVLNYSIKFMIQDVRKSK